MKSYRLTRRKKRRAVTAKVAALLEKPKLPLRVIWLAHKPEHYVIFEYEKAM